MSMQLSPPTTSNFATSLLDTSNTTAESSNRPIRRRFVVDGRVRSGCLTCKARKKKCDGPPTPDDAGGRCRSCIRLGLICEQAPLRKISPKPRQRKTTTARTKARQAGDEAQNSQSSPSSSSQATSSPEQLDNFEQHVARSEQVILRNPPAAAALESWDGKERLLLRYFLDHVAPLCSILQQDGSSFCSVLLPMAIVDRSLLHALFAYASVHFDASRAVVAESAAPAESHLEFESQVARGVADAIANNAVTEATVACALVISTAEVVGGDTSRWVLHLQGAAHLINHLGTSKLRRTSDGAFLLKYFAYHDLMAALSTGRRPLVDGVDWAENAVVDSADSFVGLAHHVLRHLAYIWAFVSDTAHLDSSSDSDQRARFTLQAEDMAQALRSQDLHLRVDEKDSHVAALIHHAEAFRFAALFFLYRHLLRFCHSSAVYKLRMDDCVRRILEHASQVPSNMFCEMGLLFPLFIAGIGSVNDNGRKEYIRNRLECIETWTKFRHVGRARELLQLLWDQGRTDWETMLREMGWNMSLA